MIIFVLFLGFRYFDVPYGEEIVYIGREKDTQRDIIRKIWTEDGLVCAIQHHLDETDLFLLVKIYKDSLYTHYVEKHSKGEKVLLEVRKGGEICVNIKGKNKKVKTPQVFDRHTLFEVFRFYNFNDPENMEIPLYVPEYKTIKANLSYAGIDTLDTKIGKLVCHHLKMRIGGLGGFISKLIGRPLNFDFWYLAEYPHYLVKFTDGKQGEIVIKAIKATGKL